jgi:hypothetical protein
MKIAAYLEPELLIAVRKITEVGSENSYYGNREKDLQPCQKFSDLHIMVSSATGGRENPTKTLHWKREVSI